MSAKRVLIAMGVVLAGVACAWPFRQSPPPPSDAPSPAITPLALTLRKPDAPLELAPRIEVSPAAELADRQGIGDRGQATGDRSRDAVEFTNIAPPPALPVSFQPSSAPEVSNDWRPKNLLTAPRPAPPPRPYRLRDGDTLEKIAGRLLGDASRAAEIFEANRQVLAQPDLLPVGVVIMLPPRAAADNVESITAGSNRLTAPMN